MTNTLTLTDFLLARITEDEDAAKGVNRGLWTSRVALLTPDLYGHVVRQHPAHVLAECEAKRRIVEWHEVRDDCCEERYGAMVFDAEPEVSAGVDSFGGLSIRQSIGHEPFVGCVTLMHLATVYADHPDYRDEWRP